MIAILAGVALKSLLIAGLTLGLLQLMRRRSAAERSAVAHVGLLALLIVAIAPVVLPSWPVETPGLMQRAAPAATIAADHSSLSTPSAQLSKSPSVVAPIAANPALSPAAVASVLYALPAAILLFLTALALARLVALRARADVLVDGHWLSALARAQRRMGFKHGTALLTSNELASPISWGVVRPVILLNGRAIEASGQAEAIIAHELAHVARMDWAKLLLARVATALFWFNPLVWSLAREAHQLREETADDAVLAADIADTDYAQLLVGVARHECPGLLLGAHGVAPSRNSLSRRVARVLDGKSVRGPAARGFGLGVFLGALLVAAPLAAVTLVPHGTSSGRAAPLVPAKAYAAYYPQSREAPADLPSIIATGVTTAVSAVGASNARQYGSEDRQAAIAEAIASARNARESALAQADQARSDAHHAIVEAKSGNRDAKIDELIEMKAVGITPDYVEAMRAAVPRLRSLAPEDFSGMKAVGVTPEYARALVSAGLRGIDSDGLEEARSVGLTGDYARAILGAGVRADLEDLIQLRAVGVPAAYPAELRRSGTPVRDADQLVELWAVGHAPTVTINVARPPTPPTPPKVPPPGWSPFASDPDG